MQLVDMIDSMELKWTLWRYKILRE
jgi:hypothetical protein